MLFVPHHDVVLVPLAADEHGVVGGGHRDRAADREPAVHHDIPPARVLQLHRLVPRVGVDEVHVLQEREHRLVLDRLEVVHAVAESGGDVVQNRVRILRARVIVGHEHDVRELIRHAAHLRALGGVAVAAAPEHGDDVRRARPPDARDGAPQRVRRVRVVHDHREGLALVHELHAPGDGLHRLHARGDDVQRNLQRHPDRHRRGDVGHVHLAHQPARRVERARGRANRDQRLEQRELGLLHEHVRLIGERRVRGVGDDRHAVAAARGGDEKRRLGRLLRLVARVVSRRLRRRVQVDHRPLPFRVRQTVEQLGFGLPVRVHRAVEVEVVGRQVREHGDVEIHAVHATLRQRVAGNLHRRRGRAVVQHARHQLLALQRVRRGVGDLVLALVRRQPSGRGALSVLRRVILLRFPDAPVRREPRVIQHVPGRADHAALAVVGFQDRTHQKRRGGLAVRAGDADGDERSARVAVKRRRETRERLFRVGDEHLRRVLGQTFDEPVAHHRHGAGRHGVQRVIVPVRLGAAAAHEDVPAENRARVVGDAAHLDVLVLAEVAPLLYVDAAVLEELAEQRDALLILRLLLEILEVLKLV